VSAISVEGKGLQMAVTIQASGPTVADAIKAFGPNFEAASDDELLVELRQRLAAKGMVVKIVAFSDEEKKINA
jgi:hypothetical protein